MSMESTWPCQLGLSANTQYYFRLIVGKKHDKIMQLIIKVVGTTTNCWGMDK